VLALYTRHSSQWHKSLRITQAYLTAHGVVFVAESGFYAAECVRFWTGFDYSVYG